MKLNKLMKNILFSLPYGVNKFFRLYLYYPLDFVDRIIRRRSNLIPPRSLINYGGYQHDDRTGREFARFFSENGLVKHGDNIMDLGCGVGHVAVPVLEGLNDSIKYEGLDVIKESVDWCTKNISSRFQNSNFTHIDVYNTYYNPEGNISGHEYQLPFETSTFDFIWLKSVFTHMRPHELTNYLAEISRVLKSGGKCLATYFLLDGESRRLVQLAKSKINFSYEVEGCLTTNPRIPEDAIAYDAETIKQLYVEHGLYIDDIRLGEWCSRGNIGQTITIQDIVVGRKL